ncbi:MAG: polysaccharide deacetylase family protein [Vicinamibacteria bacterium]
MRRLAKTGVARALHAARVDAWLAARSGTASRPLVLGYHRVVAEPADARRWLPGMSVSRATLERQLDWVGRRCRFATLDELAEPPAGGRPLAAVTFDDGYADVHENALPLLRRKGIPAAIFVVSDLVGGERLLLHDRLYLALRTAFASGERTRARLAGAFPTRASGPLPRHAFAATQHLLRRVPRDVLLRSVVALEAELGAPRSSELRLVSWAMLREMSGAGFTIGSHTRSHALLTLEEPARVREELAGSRRALEAVLGAPVRHFAYPDGRFDAAVVSAVAEAGYRRAYTTCGHTDPRRPELTLPRRLLWEQSSLDHRSRFSGAIMGCFVNGVFDLVTPCRERHGEQRA